ncbi:uncharacterized protein LOC134252486 [Saccostrea cucullata]|uniref:uncharacterized protein LOC134252486 n=1 Tax=Saccostrea cuccullata TaxID=36930 RepID=UPI002ED1218C
MSGCSRILNSTLNTAVRAPIHQCGKSNSNCLVSSLKRFVMLRYIVLFAFLIGFVQGDDQDSPFRRRCPPPPKFPENCNKVEQIYTRGCLTAYKCTSWNNAAVCAGAPTCPPPPSVDCVTSLQYKYIDGVRCGWGCRHYCCSDEETLRKTCPETSPDNPYCIATAIVKYTINRRECPVYCTCSPDCRVLTC